jgi:hypothetical protein
MSRDRRRRSVTRLAAAGALALGAVLPRAAAAQAPVLLEGLLDLEGWSTGRGSVLTARNDGRAAALARLALWSAVEPWRGFVVHAQVEVAGGPASGEEHVELELEQAGVRWQRSDALVLDAGLMPSVVGAFAGRRLSTHNPLIGRPDGYPVVYPLGLRIGGELGRIDYRAALVSRPPTDERYVPEASDAARVAIGAGVTPITGVRAGGSVTHGPYLNGALATAALHGREWCDYAQTVAAVDAQFSRGYFEARGELAYAWYDVPGVAGRAFGVTHYTELRYTLTPRLFVAARAEQNRYPYIQPGADGAWTTGRPTVTDAEIGAGYRVGVKTLLKASFRRDWWTSERAARPFLPDGYAWALQLSQGFDALAPLRR